MRVAEAMNAAGISNSGQPIEESLFVATCQDCGTDHRLSEIETQENGQQTEYVCPKCATVFVVVGPAPGLGGYRLKDNVVNPLGGMKLEVPPATN